MHFGFTCAAPCNAALCQRSHYSVCNAWFCALLVSSRKQCRACGIVVCACCASHHVCTNRFRTTDGCFHCVSRTISVLKRACLRYKSSLRCPGGRERQVDTCSQGERKLCLGQQINLKFYARKAAHGLLGCHRQRCVGPYEKGLVEMNNDLFSTAFL